MRLLVAALAMLVICGTGIALGAQGGSEPEDPSTAAAELSEPPSQDPGVELESKRTATSDTFLLPGGARETRIYENPVNYRDAGGEWKPIEEELEEVGNGALSNGANGFDVTLPQRLGAAPVRVSANGKWLAVELIGQETEAARPEGNSAGYESSGGGTDFDLTSLANGIKDEIEIADPSQPNNFAFELSASSGLAPSISEDGAVEFRDPTGDTTFTLPAPTVTDSSPGATPAPGAVHYELESVAAGAWRLIVAVDPEWLSRPAMRWPAHIDPTVTVQGAALDCTYEGLEPGSGSWHGCGTSGYQSLFAKYSLQGGVKHRWRSALKFDLSAIPDVPLAEAKIGLYSPQAALNTTAVQLRRATKSWTSDVTWARYSNADGGTWTAPGGDFTSEGSEILTSERGSGAGWWNFSKGLAPLVEKWATGAIPNQGVILKLSDDAGCEPSCSERSLLFRSSAAASSEKPYLAATYYVRAPDNSRVVSPIEGTRTAKRLKLKAAWQVSGVTGVTFQYRETNLSGEDGGGINGTFQPIPTNLVRNAEGKSVSWPMAVTGKETEALYFDAAHASTFLSSKGDGIQVRAIFEGSESAAGYSSTVNTVVDRSPGAPRDATAPVGPGSVDLLTGNFEVSRADVSIPGFTSSLSFSRSFNSRQPGKLGDKGVLGQGWQPSVSLEEASSSSWRSIKVVNYSETIEEETFSATYAVLTGPEGGEVAFEKQGESYVTPAELSGWVLAPEGSTRFVLSSPAGDRTTFENSSGGSEYLPVSISQPGGTGNTTRMIYTLAEGKRRLSMVIAPTATGVSCPTEAEAKTHSGCHALAFTYQPASTWGAPASYGERLSKITYYAPGNGGPWEVAGYAYDSTGRLSEEWDPRISPALKEKYSYEATGQIHTLTPPGQEPWTLEYGEIEGESGTGALKAVKAPSLLSSPATAQTTIAYGVPLSGSGAPYDLSAATVSGWGEQDIPLDGTAVFPPDEVPASPPSSYARASVYYMDAEGQLVNTATPSGAGTSAPSITTTETDEHGNVIRELSAQNRLRALAAGSGSITRSHELETKRRYSADGTQMEEEWGPMHQIRLESGASAQARLHRTVQYDEGAPSQGADDAKPHLPTKETSGAAIAGQADTDQRVTETHYNWTLRKPTEAIVDPGTGHLAIRTTTVYDETSGLPVETRQPSNPSGGGSGSTKIVYYSAEALSDENAECGLKPQYANLPCKVTPAKQPGTEGQPQLLVTRIASYNQLGEPTETIESPGGNEANPQRRITVAAYDSAGRQTLKHQTGGEGSPIPYTQTLYNSTNGLPTTQKFTLCGGCDNQAVTTTYDKLGRPTTYEDADGNISSTTYDLLGRPVTTSDGKGIQTRTYDPTSGLLVKLEDSGAGTFTAAYNADGNLVEEGLPDGLLAKTTYDEAGQPTHLSYEKTSCSTGCTWLDFGAERSIYGQVLSQTSLASSQQYSYDKAGRLTTVRDTPQGGGCTTRSYSFDADSNRTALVTRGPGIGGACDLASEGAKQTYSYDAADRLTGGGITYDGFGRITSLPGADAGGAALTTGYYSNDLVKSQTQGAITNSYELDATMRQRTRTEAGGSEPGTEIYHYAGGSDSPAWIDRGSSWSRNVVGIGGGLAAIQDSAKGTTLQLTNLHGDICATASTNPEATKLLASFEFDEFGNPKQGSAGKYGWLGGKGRRTELPSGIIEMGVRSYVPAMGRFISTDPVHGGSANAYDYTNADPVNGLDLAGTSPYSEACLSGFVGCKCKMWAKFTRGARGRITLTTVRKCNVAGGITLGGLGSGWGKGNGNGFHSIPPPRPVVAQVEPLCRPTDPCQNYQKHVRTFYCEPGKEYEFSLTWEFQINLEGLPAHTLDVKVEQFCPR